MELMSVCKPERFLQNASVEDCAHEEDRLTVLRLFCLIMAECASWNLDVCIEATNSRCSRSGLHIYVQSIIQGSQA